jgi:hypothetical protein
MKRRRLLIALAILALVSGAIVLLWRSPQLNPDCYDRIILGMSRSEVRRAVGQPPGDLRSGPTDISYRADKEEILSEDSMDLVADPPDYDQWQFDTGTVVVTYNRTGIAVVKGVGLGTRVEQNLFSNILWRGSRQWDKWFR